MNSNGYMYIFFKLLLKQNLLKLLKLNFTFIANFTQRVLLLLKSFCVWAGVLSVWSLLHTHTDFKRHIYILLTVIGHQVVLWLVIGINNCCAFLFVRKELMWKEELYTLPSAYFPGCYWLKQFGVIQTEFLLHIIIFNKISKYDS